MAGSDIADTFLLLLTSQSQSRENVVIGSRINPLTNNLKGSLLVHGTFLGFICNCLPYLLEKAPPPIKRLPRLSAAYESKNIKEHRPRISAAFINNAALNRSTILRSTAATRCRLLDSYQEGDSDVDIL